MTYVKISEQELSCCWDGHAALHKSNREKMGYASFGRKLGENKVHDHESYNAKK